MRVMIRPSITVQAHLVTFLGIIACQEPPLVPALNPVDQALVEIRAFLSLRPLMRWWRRMRCALR